MWKSRKAGLLAVAIVVGLVGAWRLTAGAPSLDEQRAKLTKAYADGNFKVAYEGLRKLALDPKNDRILVGNSKAGRHRWTGSPTLVCGNPSAGFPRFC